MIRYRPVTVHKIVLAFSLCIANIFVTFTADILLNDILGHILSLLLCEQKGLSNEAQMCTRSPKYLMLNTAFVFNVHCILSIFPQLIGILNFIHSVFSHPVFSQSPNLDSVQIYFSALCLPVNQTITSHIQRGHLVPSLLLRHVCYYFEVTRFQQAPYKEHVFF